MKERRKREPFEEKDGNCIIEESKSKIQSFVVAEYVGWTFALRRRDKKNFSTALYEG